MNEIPQRSTGAGIGSVPVLKDFFLAIYDDLSNTYSKYVANLLRFPILPKISGDKADVKWEVIDVPFATESWAYWMETGSRSISVSAEFTATYDAMKEVIEPVRWIRALQYPISYAGYGEGYGKIYRPPYVLLVLGEWFRMIGYVSGVGVEYGMDKGLVSAVTRTNYNEISDEMKAMNTKISQLGLQENWNNIPIQATVSFTLTSLKPSNPFNNNLERQTEIKEDKEKSAKAKKFTFKEVAYGYDEGQF